MKYIAAIAPDGSEGCITTVENWDRHEFLRMTNDEVPVPMELVAEFEAETWERAKEIGDGKLDEARNTRVVYPSDEGDE